MRVQERSKDKIKFLKRNIEKYSRVECIALFVEKFRCNMATAYDWYHIIKTGTRSGHQLNSRKYKYSKLQCCYFCGKEAKHRHHTNYEKDITIPLCNACHRKIHFMYK